MLLLLGTTQFSPPGAFPDPPAGRNLQATQSLADLCHKPLSCLLCLAQRTAENMRDRLKERHGHGSFLFKLGSSVPAQLPGAPGHDVAGLIPGHSLGAESRRWAQHYKPGKTSGRESH
jgi:hypothetical protein